MAQRLPLPEKVWDQQAKDHAKGHVRSWQPSERISCTQAFWRVDVHQVVLVEGVPQKVNLQSRDAAELS